MPNSIRAITRLQDADDLTGTLTDTYVPVWSSAQGKFVMTAQSGGTTDHTLLSNIGTNTHAQIDTHLAATATHGATGAIAGTTNTQTLTNKTLTTPTIGDFTNAQHLHVGAASGGLIVPIGGTTDHAALSNLSYAAAGHTGFAGTGVANTFTATQTMTVATGNTLTITRDSSYTGMPIRISEQPSDITQFSVAASGATFIRNRGAVTEVNLTLQAISAQTGDFLKCVDSGGTVVNGIKADGSFYAVKPFSMPMTVSGNGITITRDSSYTGMPIRISEQPTDIAQFSVAASGATFIRNRGAVTEVNLTLQAISAQTGDFLKCVDSNGTVVATVKSTGYIGAGLTTATSVVDIAASNTARASLRIRDGVAPTTPNAGDLWYVISGRLIFQRGATAEMVATGVQATGGSATASATWTATEQSMLQKIYDAGRVFGLLS